MIYNTKDYNLILFLIKYDIVVVWIISIIILSKRKFIEFFSGDLLNGDEGWGAEAIAAPFPSLKLTHEHFKMNTYTI